MVDTDDTRQTTDNARGELKNQAKKGANALNRETQKTYPGEYKDKQLRRSRQAWSKFGK